MKRIATFLLSLLVVASLAACGGGGETTQPETGTWGESNWNQVRWGP